MLLFQMLIILAILVSLEYPTKISYYILLANWAGEPGGQISDQPTEVSAGHVEHFYSQRMLVKNCVEAKMEINLFKSIV